MAIKFRYPVICCSSSKVSDVAFIAASMILRALSSFFCGSRTTIFFVSNSTPPKLATVPSSFFATFITVTCVHVPVTVHRSGQCRISYV